MSLELLWLLHAVWTVCTSLHTKTNRLANSSTSRTFFLIYLLKKSGYNNKRNYYCSQNQMKVDWLTLMLCSSKMLCLIIILASSKQ